MPGQEAAIKVDDIGIIDMHRLKVIEVAAGARNEGRWVLRGEALEAFDGGNVGVFLFGGEG